MSESMDRIQDTIGPFRNSNELDGGAKAKRRKRIERKMREKRRNRVWQ